MNRMNKTLLALPVLILALSAVSGCTAPPTEDTPSHTTTTTTTDEASETETTGETSLFNESQLEELEAELSALEAELDNLQETDELNITDV